MSQNLNAFSSEQLQVLLNLVVARIVDLEEFRHEWESFFCKDMRLSFEEHAPEKFKEYETLQLFRVQILNAIAEVRMKEDILSN